MTQQSSNSDERGAGGTPDVGNKTTDRLAAIGRSLAGTVPFAGGLLAEVITEIIPNQRMDRVEQYLEYLARRLSELEKSRLAESITKAENIALVEEGAFQAARAIQQERREKIANCVALGIADEDRSNLKSARILEILAQLDDGDIQLLHAHAGNDRSAFKEIRPEPALIGSKSSIIEDNNLYERSHKKLEQLGLLKVRISVDTETHLPEFDRFSGEPRGHHYITAIGRLLLHRVGLNTPETT